MITPSRGATTVNSLPPLVVDTRSGKIVAQVPTGAGTDAAAFDAREKLVFASNGEKIRGFTECDFFRPSDVEQKGWRLTKSERTQCVRVGIALPNGVEGLHTQIDRLPATDFPGNIRQNAVTQIGGVIQPVEEAAGVVFMGILFKHSFPAEAGLRIFSNWIQCIRLHRPRRRYWQQRVQVSRGKDYNPAGGKRLGHLGGNQCIADPGEIRTIAASKFPARQVNDVFTTRQGADLVMVQQIAGPGLNAAFLKPFLGTGGGKA